MSAPSVTPEGIFAQPEGQRQKAIQYALFSAVAITTVIGGASFVLSFAALWDLATRAGLPRSLSWLWPVIVDGTILQATIAVIALAAHPEQKKGRQFFWTVLAVSAAVSIASNGLHAFIAHNSTLHPALAAAIATVAPISLLAATHGIAVLTRVPRQSASPAQAVALPEPALVITEPMNQDPVSVVAQPLQAEEAPVDHYTAEAYEDDSAGIDPMDLETAKATVLEHSRKHWQGVAATMRARQLTTRSTDEVAEMLRMRFDEEQSFRTIGEHFRVTHSTVSNLVQKAESVMNEVPSDHDWTEALIPSYA